MLDNDLTDLGKQGLLPICLKALWFSTSTRTSGAFVWAQMMTHNRDDYKASI